MGKEKWKFIGYCFLLYEFINKLTFKKVITNKLTSLKTSVEI